MRRKAMKKTYDIVVIFYIIDEIVKKLKEEGSLYKNGLGRPSKLSLSELLTIAIVGHLEQIASQKRLYCRIQSDEFKDLFPNMPTYGQFNKGMLDTESHMNAIISALGCLSHA